MNVFVAEAVWVFALLLLPCVCILLVVPSTGEGYRVVCRGTGSSSGWVGRGNVCKLTQILSACETRVFAAAAAAARLIAVLGKAAPGIGSQESRAGAFPFPIIVKDPRFDFLRTFMRRFLWKRLQLAAEASRSWFHAVTCCRLHILRWTLDSPLIREWHGTKQNKTKWNKIK